MERIFVVKEGKTMRGHTYTAGSTQTEKKFDTIYYQLCY